MDKSSADAFVFAKASGMLARSFVGSRAENLFNAKKLSELWTLLFLDEVPLIPDALMAKEIEKKAEKKFIDEFTMLLGCYSKASDVCLALLKFYDCNNLRSIVYALSEEEKSLPELVDIGKYSELKLSEWPNLEKITSKGMFSWYKSIPNLEEQSNIEHKLDFQYLSYLWKAVNDLPLAEKHPVKEFIQEKIILDNCIWALRLRVYYQMKKEDVISRLFNLDCESPFEDKLCAEALKILDFDLDTYTDWYKWKYNFLINENNEGDVWLIDPIWVQQNAKIYLSKKAYKSFRQHPFTVNVLVTWFFIKQHELDCIRSAAEELRLNSNI